jgi:hypothetical protein
MMFAVPFTVGPASVAAVIDAVEVVADPGEVDAFGVPAPVAAPPQPATVSAAPSTQAPARAATLDRFIG